MYSFINSCTPAAVENAIRTEQATTTLAITNLEKGISTPAARKLSDIPNQITMIGTKATRGTE